jgi:serine/threonine protein phosphatase PrpC
LLLYPEEVDARADLYAFGALLYALSLGRELSELDFTLTGMPRPYLERIPDANPFLARVLAKTFVREVDDRFPADDGPGTDRTGFRELIQALRACQRNLDRVKLDVAAWSTTGIVRSSNEDAVAVVHTTENKLDDSEEAALIVLADGMGGMESGEVAAAMALNTIREILSSGPPFALAPSVTKPAEEELPDTLDRDLSEEPGEIEPLPPTPLPLTVDKNSPERSADAHASRVAEALREANHRIFQAACDNPSARGMGCTSEVVLVDGRLAIVGHVGDSRVYRMRRGKLVQVTRDHTLVNRLVELGQITEKEAETHPRRSELHQAVGGRPEVYPDVYCVTLEPGDWLVVCSDGLSNQASLEVIQAALRESKNAEQAARRLINAVLLDGAQDNVSVAVVRAA